jgi:hypothetical protein
MAGGLRMTEQQEDQLRSAARAWLDAIDRLDRAMAAPDAGPEVMDAADAATIARLRFQQTLILLGWTPPAPVGSDQG